MVNWKEREKKILCEESLSVFGVCLYDKQAEELDSYSSSCSFLSSLYNGRCFQWWPSGAVWCSRWTWWFWSCKKLCGVHPWGKLTTKPLIFFPFASLPNPATQLILCPLTSLILLDIQKRDPSEGLVHNDLQENWRKTTTRWGIWSRCLCLSSTYPKRRAKYEHISEEICAIQGTFYLFLTPLHFSYMISGIRFKEMLHR